MIVFLSTPSARRATYWTTTGSPWLQISIHALREEGDGCLFLFTRWLSYFYPRPPRGGRPRAVLDLFGESLFLSTPSARRATAPWLMDALKLIISIHALREEGDPLPRVSGHQTGEFLSTPSARRATDCRHGVIAHLFISIHALREEGDQRKKVFALSVQISIHALREEGDLSCG